MITKLMGYYQMSYSINKTISDSGENVYIYEDEEVKVPLNSLYSPEKEADRFIRKLNDLKNNFVIFIGFGNGALLKSLEKSEVFEQNIHFLFVEPFDEIMSDNEHITSLVNNNKLSFFIAEDFNSVIFARFISKFTSIPVTIQVHPNYLKANSSRIRDCLRIINEGVETKQILNNTEVKFSVDWIIEPLLNTQHILRSINIKNLQGKFQGESAILAASGPSLKEHMEFLKENHESYHLFSVGSALRALLDNGVHPDYTLSVDASSRNFETHFKDLDYNGILIFETMSNSNIQKQHQGNLVVSNAASDRITSQMYNDLYTFTQASPSVAIYTLQVIAYLGFSKVYLVGQDLALVNGSYYASGIKHHAGMQDLKNELWVESNLGERVGTTRALKIFLDSFESLIKTLPKDIQIYNLSKHGAKIKGTTFVDVNEMKMGIKNSIKFDSNHIQSTQNKDFSIKEFLLRLDALQEEVKRANKNLRRLIQTGGVSPNDMVKVVKMFRGVAKHKVLEEIILSNLTFMFDSIINKFAYLEEKEKYISQDLLRMIKDLNRFYGLVEKYIGQVLEDERLLPYR